MSKYKHFCYEWDEMEIDETWPEFECCTCYPPSEEIKELKKKLEDKYE